MTARRTSLSGFTLLEVMVAVAILALSLTAIFASEAGAIRIAHRARTISVATMLARCKMAEVEELVAKEGLPAVERVESDKCCEGAEMDGYTCDWKIQRIVLPDASLSGSGPGDDLAENLGSKSATGTGTDPIMGMAAAGGIADGAIGDLVLSYAFPAIKSSIEEQVRRATVVVHWKEGQGDHSFDVVQFLVDERGVAQPAADDGSGITDDGTSGGAAPAADGTTNGAGGAAGRGNAPVINR